MLLEFVAASVVILVLFVGVYQLLLPIVAKVESDLFYNDIKAVYNAFYVKKMFFLDYQNEDISLNNEGIMVLYDGQCHISSEYKDRCNEVCSALNISDVIITKNDLNANYNGVFSSYIDYLRKDAANDNSYLLLVKTNDNLYGKTSYLNNQTFVSLSIVSEGKKVVLTNDLTKEEYVVESDMVINNVLSGSTFTIDDFSNVQLNGEYLTSDTFILDSFGVLYISSGGALNEA